MFMVEFIDLLQQEDFRHFVSNRLANSSNTNYYFPNTLPKLYQYKPLSKYSVDDICTRRITATSIGEFNDFFDGAFHQYGTEKERAKAAEEEWQKINSLRVSLNLNSTGLDHDSYTGMVKKFYAKDSRYKFRALEFLGTYVSCFSLENNSILMWSHYSKSNTGICVEYDFNTLPERRHKLKNSIFPVQYTNSPIYLSDLLDDEYKNIFKYHIEAAVLCSALNKSNVWSYEKEWRLVSVWPFLNTFPRRLSIETNIQPSKIYLGYHFLRPLFYYDMKTEYTEAESNVEQLLRLINYMDEHNIGIYIMMPSIGQFALKPYKVQPKKIQNFLTRNFKENKPENISYYHIIHDDFVDLLE